MSAMIKILGEIANALNKLPPVFQFYSDFRVSCTRIDEFLSCDEMNNEFINPKTPYKGLLIYHQIGAGKTCAAISIAENWKHKRNIIVSINNSIKTNERGTK